MRIRNPIQALDLPWVDIQAVEATDGGAMTITSATFGQVPVWVYQESPIGFLLGGYSAKRARNVILSASPPDGLAGTAGRTPRSRRNLPLLLPLVYWLMLVAVIHWT